MIWRTTDYKGNERVWYSEDVILRIRELAQMYLTDCQGFKCDAMNEILDIINEVNNENTKN